MSTVYLAVTPHGCEICHMGVKGMRWGIRRYRNLDGSYNERGRARRDKYVSKMIKKNNRDYERYQKRYQKKSDRALTEDEKSMWLKRKNQLKSDHKKNNDAIRNMSVEDALIADRNRKVKTAITAGAIVLGTGAAISLGTSLAVANSVVKNTTSVAKNVRFYNSMFKDVKNVLYSEMTKSLKDLPEHERKMKEAQSNFEKLEKENAEFMANHSRKMAALEYEARMKGLE